MTKFTQINLINDPAPHKCPVLNFQGIHVNFHLFFVPFMTYTFSQHYKVSQQSCYFKTLGIEIFTLRMQPVVNREFKQTTTAMGTPLNKRFHEQNNGCARALYFFVHFFAVLCKATT